MEDPENGMNEHKNIEVTEIEEKKQLDLPLLLNGSPPFKPIISIDASVFLLTISKIKETTSKVEDIQKAVILSKEKELIHKLLYTLSILLDQYTMIEEIYVLKMTVEQNAEDLQKLLDKNIHLKEFLINIPNTDAFNDIMLSKIDPFLNETLNNFQKKLTKLKRNLTSSKKNFYFSFISIYETKLHYIVEFMPFIVMYPKEDLLCKEKNHPDWKQILPYYEESTVVSEKDMLKQLKKFGNMLNASSAVYYDNFLRVNKCCKGLKMTKDAIYYFFCSKKAKNRAHLFYANPDVQTAISIWNIPDKTFVKGFMKMGYPCIKISKRIYLERTMESITLESIIEEYKSGIINKKESLLNSPSDIQGACNRPLNSLYHRGPNQVKVRLLSSIKLNEKMNSKPISSTLLIHIHGGGFISMSSFSHQCYTRLFAKRTNIPVFSIDYRLSPENPYPLGFDDCWQAYNWLLKNSLKYFGIDTKKVILTGDSAGGNLVSAITIACIKKGVRKPDGLFLMYPALNTSKEGFTPSYMKAFNDVVLQHTFLKICMNSYVADPRLKPGIDPYLSPRKASDEILNEFPPVRILSGGRDPLSDDSLKFLQKMIQLKKDIKMKTYLGLPHGFMNYDYVGGLSPAKIAISDACRLLDEFIKEIGQKGENLV